MAMRRHSPGPWSLLAARRATAVALALQWWIVVTGATVRLTGSGLGCPNWPTCTRTRPVPQLEQHALIEFLNRMTTTPTLLAALVSLWICWRVARPDGAAPRRDLRISTALVVGGIFVQAALGALTVILELPPEIVAVHFLVSISLIATATFAWVAAGSTTPLRLARGRTPAAVRAAAAGAMLLLLLAIIVAGVLTTASGPHSGASGTGQAIDRFGLFSIAVTLHARGAYAFLVLVVGLTWLRARRREAIRDLGVLLTLVAVQITLGEIQYRNGLPWQVVLAHVANAALLWLVASRIAIGAMTVASPGPRTSVTVAPAPADRYDPVSA
ncbi:MAG: cytochrome oxidase assembly [Thermoleophilia bacterium]|nr:cytochrome oxidase assembly [Thermoleophilia bacterium]